MGHSHQAEILPIGDGFYANAGEWIKRPSYLEITDGNITLKQYKTNNKENEQ
jgi:UDP-2,3-diacylglucosamine pyrophosphatase LpxH